MKKHFKILTIFIALVAILVLPHTSVAKAEESTTEKVRIHYCRDDANYKDWNIWIWQYEPKSAEGEQYDFLKTSDGSLATDDYGVYLDVDLVSDPILKGSTTLGFIIRYKDWTSGIRDIADDRFIEIPATAEGGLYEVYIYQGFTQVYKTADEAKNDKIKTASFTDMTTLEVNVLTSQTLTADKFRVYADEVVINNYQFTYTTNLIKAKFAEDIALEKSYRIEVDFESGTRGLTVDSSRLYDYPQFYNNFTYYGDDLGVTFSKDHKTTTFKLWAPLSSKVVLNLYNNGTPSSYRQDGIIVSSTPSHRYVMHKEQQGVWSHTEYTNLHGVYYTYTVYNGSRSNEVVDPYAKGCGINGERGLVVDFDKINEEIGFEIGKRPNVIKNATDAIIYETHVRDLTIDPSWGGSEENAGKYLGVIEKGTSYSANGRSVTTGFDHLKELGITHIQLMPVYDISSVDESLEQPNYNWGYDPLNYNCLEGSYSSNPYDGLVRIKEFKQMMMGLTEAGIAVNMDVVFNHTARTSNSNFNLIVPNYYHRTNADGAFLNGSGCGNEVASQRPMVRKFITDSTKFWFNEYNLSGFRFDLMALLDTTTMETVYKQCQEIYPQAMVYGEPWGGYGATYDGYVSTNQNTLKTIDGVGGFNDQIRDAVKGENNDTSTGFVQNNVSNVWKIVNGIKGTFNGSSVDPTRVVNYVACHDNLTLHDKIATSPRTTNDVTIKLRNNQADSIIMLSEGIPFMLAGQDFLRSKPKDPNSSYGEINSAGYDHNSYRSTDYTNSLKWDQKLKYSDVFKYYKDLITLRKTYPGFRIATSAGVSGALTIVSGEGSTIGYKINYNNQELYVIHSASGSNYSLGGTYKVIFNKSGLVTNGQSSTAYSVAANESVVLIKA